MEELENQVGDVLLKAREVEDKWDTEIEKMQETLKSILFGPTVVSLGSTTPQQVKKKTRLSAIVDTDEESMRYSVEALRKNSIEVTKKRLVDDAGSPTPSNANTSYETIAETNVTRSGRPTRTAKIKAGECLKEPPIKGKLRRPTIEGDNTTFRGEITIKKEKDELKAPKKPSKKDQAEAVRKSSLSSNPSDSSQRKEEEDENSKKNDESLIVIPNKQSTVEIMSEDETDIMPPPAAVPKKKDKKKKFQPLVVKVEKLSIGSMCSASTEATLTNETEMAVAEPAETESAEENVSKTSSKSEKSKKKKHRPIKVERFSDVALDSAGPSSRTRKFSREKKSLESVYEDAIADVEVKSAPEPQPDATFVSAKANSVGKISNPPDATFVANPTNATFVSNPIQATFVMDNNPNATVSINPSNIPDSTFNIQAAVAASDERNSLLTEDESDESPTPVALPRSKVKMELMTPCAPSPVKKMVEAFEKVAEKANLASPAPQRQTRTKTRLRTKENEEINEQSDAKLPSNITPLIGKLGPNLGRFLTPTQSSNITPVIGGMLAKKLPSSTSKLMTFPKSTFGSASSLKSATSSTSTLSRENSAEDVKRGYTKLQQQADERKKKREQKQQQAAQQREAKEKERSDRLKKLMEEREEKQRKKVQESEQRKRELEEINRNLKLQEEKRDAQRRLERQKNEREMAEAARKEREHLEHLKILKAKKEIQFKLQEQKKAAAKRQKYDFQMLHSDDSTDDEGKVSHKRPPPPSWSLSNQRRVLIENQSSLPTKIIDSFFSVQPMTPDLKEIFPAIDPRYLKRNSSVIWRTPPRYSEMPKY